MELINKYKQHIKELFCLAMPLFIGNLGHTLIGATDVFVIAKYNIKSLSAVSIANSIFFTIMILGIGIIVAVSIILSNLRGAKQKTKRYLASTLILSLILAVIFSIICYSMKYVVANIGLEAELIPYIQEYLSIVAFSLFGIFIYEGIKQFLQSYEIVNFPNILSLCAVALNLIFDIVFIFGFGFIPEMGSRGAAIATLCVRTIGGIVMVAYVFRFINFKDKFDLSYTKKVVTTGIPIGIALLLEFLAFNIVTVLVGMESGILSAVHSILITISTATFMMPLAISTALSVKVAYHFGANNPDEIKIYSYTALYMVIGFMVLISLGLFIYPSGIIAIFTTDSRVMQIAVPLISILAAYQIFDGIQGVMGGILKGFKKTETVFLIVLSGYWLIGAPIAYILVTKYDMSLKGYWLALAMSLFAMGLIQAIAAKRVFNKLRKECNN